MPEKISPGFKRLAVAAAVALYLLIIAGGVVRITGSGLGCPDWPLCYGQVIPPLEQTALIEYTHRLIALLAGVLILLVAGWAWLRFRRRPWIVVPALGVIVLLAIQIPLGRVIVVTELSPQAVAFHLGMALLIFGGMLAAAVAAILPASPPRRATPFAYRALIASTLAMMFLVLVTGALVVGGGGSHLCPDWPLCDGQLIPLGQANPGLAIQLLHRYAVALVSIQLIALIAATFGQKQPLAGVRAWTLALAGLYAAQIAVGAFQVGTGMPVLWRSLHVALAAGVWACLVILASLTFAGAAAAAERAQPTPSPTLPAAAK